MTDALAEMLIYRSCLITYSIMSGTNGVGDDGLFSRDWLVGASTHWPDFTRSLCLFWIYTA